MEMFFLLAPSRGGLGSFLLLFLPGLVVFRIKYSPELHSTAIAHHCRETQTVSWVYDFLSRFSFIVIMRINDCLQLLDPRQHEIFGTYCTCACRTMALS